MNEHGAVKWQLAVQLCRGSYARGGTSRVFSFACGQAREMAAELAQRQIRSVSRWHIQQHLALFDAPVAI